MNKCRNLDIVKSGQKIKKAIQDKGYTVRQIQEILGFECPQPIYRWYKGITLPSIDNLYILSQLLGIHMEDLLVEREVKQVEIPKEEKKSIWD